MLKTTELLRQPLIFIAAVLLLPLLASGQGFTRITDDAGAYFFHSSSVFGGGVSLSDFNNDNYDDISLVGNNEEPAFFINQQDGTFVPVDLGITGTTGDMKAVIWVDIDNDGDKDLLMTSNFAGIKLYENLGSLEFEDITASAGFSDLNTRYFGASWGDYDNDGWLDLYLCNYHNPDINEGPEYENLLFHNNGDGTFTDVSLEAGVSDGVAPSFQSLWLDYDEDGDQDLFVINDRVSQSNSLYENQGDGTFLDVSVERGWLNFSDSMSLAAGDYDNDEDIDIFIADTFDYHNDLMKFDSSTLLFQNISAAAGLEWDTISWGSLWIDYDCDMLQDLYVSGEGNESSLAIVNNFYRNNGDDTFTSIRNEVGLGVHEAATYTAAMGDFTNDGYPDFVQNNSGSFSELWQNDGGSNNYLKVKVYGTVSNAQGIGTWIRCHAGGIVQTRHTFCGENYMSQDSDYEFFGLGDVAAVDSLVVTYLSGHRDVYYDVAVNQHLRLEEGDALDPNLFAQNTVICTGDSVAISVGDWASYEWSTGDTGPNIFVQESGNYWVTVFTENGIAANSDTLEISQGTPPVIDAEVADTWCVNSANGSIDLALNPEDFDTISWVNGASGPSIDSLIAGTYVFTLVDDSGCAYTDSIEVGVLDGFISSVIETDSTLCFNDSSGSVTISTLEWQGGLDLISPQDMALAWNADSTQLEISGFPAGSFDYLIQDFSGCFSTNSFTIGQPAPLVGDLSIVGVTDDPATVTASIEGGTPPYSLEWSTGDVDVFEVSFTEAGEFWLSVTDANSCELHLNFSVTSIAEAGFSEMRLYPNPTSAHLTVEGPERIDRIRVFSATGDEVLHSAPFSQSASIDLGDLPAGLYCLMIRAGQKWSSQRVLKIEP